MKKLLLTLVFVSTILQVNAQNGQVYVYKTSNYASDAGLSGAYLAVMGAATVNSDTPPAVTSYTASTVSPYYKFKTGELGNASIDVGIAGLDNGAMTLLTSGSGSDLDGVLDALNPINSSGSGQLIVVFPKGSDMTVPTSIQETLNGVAGGAVPYLNADGNGFFINGGVIHSITLDTPHLGYSEWYVYGMAGFNTINTKFKFRLVDASGSAPTPSGWTSLYDIIIAEIMYNSSGTDDEWIEIYNASEEISGSAADVDISNWTIGTNTVGSSEYSGETFTFPSSTTIAAGEYLTIALGSNGDGVFNNDNPFTPDFNSLSGSPSNADVKDTNDTDNLGNDGGFIVLRPNNFDTVNIVYYDDDTHTITDGSGRTYEIKGPTFNNSFTSSASAWQASFITGGSPKIKSAEIWDTSLGSSDNLTILNNENIFVVNQDGNINDITINSGGFLTILRNSSSSLTVANNFTNNGTVTLNSDADEFASIIVGGTSSGDITYNRYVNTVGTDEWDLIGSPVDGLSINSFVTTNTTGTATLAQNGSAYAVGVYDNANDTWTNYTTSTAGAAGNFDIGKGYQMATTSGATMTFTGTIATSNQTQSIINNVNSSGSRWNLVANPYPSYLNANTNTHPTNNFLSINSGVIDSNYSALYGYNADGSGYTIYNNTSGATYIAPGQGFFIAAASSTAADLSFTEDMKTTTGDDDFIAGRLSNTNSEFYLKLYEDENFIADTKFYFDVDLIPGLDVGYDAGALNQSTAIASRLVEEDQGIAMGINAMGTNSFEDTTIPLVVNKDDGVTFRISLEAATIPEETEVYLEDTQEATFTDLRAGDFTLTPQSELSGMGRFYLRLGNTNLGSEEVEESYISIYKSKAEKYITIEGLANVTQANVKLYNLLGQELLSQNLETNISSQKIPTDGITTGVYVVKLLVNGNRITKKVIIN